MALPTPGVPKSHFGFCKCSTQNSGGPARRYRRFSWSCQLSSRRSAPWSSGRSLTELTLEIIDVSPWSRKVHHVNPKAFFRQRQINIGFYHQFIYINIYTVQRWARATFFWVRNRNSATWRKHLRNRKSATFKEMLLRNRNSAIPQLQFFLKSVTSSPQLELFTSAIFGIFSAVEDIERILKGQEYKIFGFRFLWIPHMNPWVIL